VRSNWLAAISAESCPMFVFSITAFRDEYSAENLSDSHRFWSRTQHIPVFHVIALLLRKTRVGPRYHVLDMGRDPATGRGNLGGCPIHWKALTVSTAAIYAAKNNNRRLVALAAMSRLVS